MTTSLVETSSEAAKASFALTALEVVIVVLVVTSSDIATTFGAVTDLFDMRELQDASTSIALRYLRVHLMIVSHFYMEMAVSIVIAWHVIIYCHGKFIALK